MPQERDDKGKRQRYAEAYGMGDILVGKTITGRYPNPPAIQQIKPPLTLEQRALVEAVKDAVGRALGWPYVGGGR